jgi:hypothetical protein
MAKRRNLIDRLPLAPVFALLFGAAVAIVIASLPQWRFEQAIEWTGLGSILSVARPPLGLKARLLAVMLGFALVAIIVWLAVTAVERALMLRVAQDDNEAFLDLAAFAESLPPLEKPRRPIFADKELGAPFMSDEALKTVPAPLPVFSPAQAMPAQPLVDVVAPSAGRVPQVLMETPALEALLDVAEFDLPPAPPAFPEAQSESSIDTLIRRLEAGLARRAGPCPPTPPSSTPPSTTPSPIPVIRDLLERNRETERHRQTDGPNETASARALDTLGRLAARQVAL